jgi:hypothetical protein
VVAKTFEGSREFELMKRLDPERAGLFWTLDRVAALETGEIVGRLAELGANGSREPFLELAAERTSAWTVSDEWLAGIDKPLSRHEQDFVGIAACELWKRFCPERPSLEMLDDWMQDGYDLSETGQGPEACDRWWSVWEVIHSRLTPEMRTCYSASPVFDGTQSIQNWVQDFQMELYNAARVEVRYARMGARLCEQVLARFTGDEGLFIRNFRAELGEFYYMEGRHDGGERVLMDLIRDHPDRAIGYASLANLLAHGACRDDGPIDPQRARALLEEALALPVIDAEDYGLEYRLNELLGSGASKP